MHTTDWRCAIVWRLLVLFVLLAGFPASALAEITRIAIQTTQLYGDFTSGKYIRIEGEALGVLSPGEAIPDLDKAPRNSAGLVEYRTRITLLMPESARNGNGALLVELPNRGRPISHAFYNSPRSRPILAGSLDEGTGFLENRGYSVVVVQWELGEGIELPASTDERGVKRYVEGIGFLAARDIATFLRYDTTPGNPLAGAIDRVLAVGYSQTARYLKSFLINGFNERGGIMVFNGVHIVGGAAGILPLLASGPGPRSVAAKHPVYNEPDVRGINEEPFTYGDIMKRVGEKNRTQPRVIVTHMQTDYLSLRASLARTGVTGSADLPLPENVRMYDITGAAHLNIRQQNKACREPHGQLDWPAALRAQLIALDEWVRQGIVPPDSQLMPLQARPDSTALPAPSYLPQATIMLPKLDADGNALGGLRLPDIEVPIATYGNLNAPLTHTECMLAGTYRPFAKTSAERQATGDTRPSLQERYPGGINEYTSRVRTAVKNLVAKRLLLKEDGIIIVHAAAENPSFEQTPPRSRWSTGGPR